MEANMWGFSHRALAARQSPVLPYLLSGHHELQQFGGKVLLVNEPRDPNRVARMSPTRLLYNSTIKIDRSDGGRRAPLFFSGFDFYAANNSCGPRTNMQR